MIFTLFIFFELKNKILGLDILRSIAILLVVIGHGSFMYAHTFLEKFPFVPMVNGVDIFFVLSGFLIGNILLKQLDKGLDIGALKTFYIRRWLRTLPLYYIILFANYCFTKYGFIREDLSKFTRDNFVIKNPIDGLFKFLIYLILVYFVSSILYYGIEKPILQYRDTQFKD